MADCSTLCEGKQLRAEFPKVDAKIQRLFFFFLKPFKNTHLAFFLKYIVYKIRQLEETKRMSPLLRYCILPPKRVTVLPVEKSHPAAKLLRARRGATRSDDALNLRKTPGHSRRQPLHASRGREGSHLSGGSWGGSCFCQGCCSRSGNRVGKDPPTSGGPQGQRQHRRWNDLISPQN